MSTTNVGNPMQGRRLKGGNSGQEAIAIKADKILVSGFQSLQKVSEN